MNDEFTLANIKELSKILLKLLFKRFDRLVFTKAIS